MDANLYWKKWCFILVVSLRLLENFEEFKKQNCQNNWSNSWGGRKRRKMKGQK